MLYIEQLMTITNHKYMTLLTLKVLVATIDAEWEGMGDVGLARYDNT